MLWFGAVTVGPGVDVDDHVESFTVASAVERDIERHESDAGICVCGRLQANGARLARFGGESSFEHFRVCSQTGWSVDFDPMPLAT